VTLQLEPRALGAYRIVAGDTFAAAMHFLGLRICTLEPPKPGQAWRFDCGGVPVAVYKTGGVFCKDASLLDGLIVAVPDDLFSEVQP
jgi:hypothetical protein